MGPHGTWFDFIPGIEAWKAQAKQHLGREWTWQVFQATYFEITHVLVAALVVLLLILGAVGYKRQIQRLGDAAVLPPTRLGLRAVFEGLADIVFGLLEGVMGEKQARKFLPFLGSFFVFILFSNLISLVPGFRAPTDTLKTNIGLALLVFFATHILGFREHGIRYLEQFTGHLPHRSLEMLKEGQIFPAVILMALVPVMFGIELISHLIRPATLAIRLMANMFADHAVVGVFFGLVSVPLVYPVPLMLLGVFVSVVQALVFTLMSATYISLAIAHEEH
jgi:F-type H+-transporting ATPase subunit a